MQWMRALMGMRRTQGCLLGLVLLSIATVSRGEGLSVNSDESVVNFSVAEGQLTLRYRHSGVPFKPYVDRLATPSGVNVLLDAPADHLHHHALMYAVKVNDANFWEEGTNPAHELGREITVLQTLGEADPYAQLTHVIDWLTPDKAQTLLNETRVVRLHAGAREGATLLTWETTFEAAPGHEQVELSGSHYFGLGLRFVEEMNRVGAFRYATGSPGDIVRGDERVTDADWCAYTAPIGGKPVTVAMFGAPENVRHPTPWFTMKNSFAYMSATMRLHETPLAVRAGVPLKLRYGVALWDGHVSDETIAKAYQYWIGLGR